jgi:hypothetical protein
MTQHDLSMIHALYSTSVGSWIEVLASLDLTMCARLQTLLDPGADGPMEFALNFGYLVSGPSS